MVVVEVEMNNVRVGEDTSRTVGAIGFPRQSMDPAMRKMNVVRKVIIAAYN